MLNVIINGACGKMGRMLSEMAAMQEGVTIVAGVDKFAAGATASYPLFERLDEVTAPADVIVDFSRPDAVEDILAYCKKNHCACVLATTAYSAQQEHAVVEASREIPVFRSANMSLGINLILDLVRQAAVTLKDFDIEIVEAHHKTKIDCPSGTALMLADAINEVCMGEKEYVYGRHTKTERRGSREIGIHALRGGTITGEHDVKFIGSDEIVEIRHSAQSRAIFAGGALKAACFMAGKPAGLYSMKDVLLANAAVTSLTDDPAQALLNVQVPFEGTTVSRLFAGLAQAGIVVDMISQSAPRNDGIDLAITVPADSFAAACAAVASCGAKLTFSKAPVAKLTINGLGMERQSGVAAKVFETLARAGMTPYMITTSETSIAVCLEVDQLPAAKQAVRGVFDLGN
jgi:4-hydroxy-tetrahydrodipicolinate reductase